MKSLFREYFSFSFSERRGLLILAFILISIIIIPEIISPNKANFDLHKYDNQINSFIDKSREISENNYNLDDLVLFEFDPNTLQEEGWNALGLNQKQFNTLDNFRKKGGKFYNTEDLSKIYGFPIELYEKLEPYINIPQKAKRNYQKTKFKKRDYVKSNKVYKDSEIVLDINFADSIDLIMIQGIGPVFASRIIKYRESLGGFIHLNQLKEVYGIDEQKFSQIKDRFKLDSIIIKKINLNDASYTTLIKHPYLNKENVRRILKYKEIMRKIDKPESLLKDGIIDSVCFNRIKNYFSTN